MVTSYEHCGSTFDASRDELLQIRGPLRCATCSNFVTTVDVTGSKDWIELQVNRKRAEQQAGDLATRKQSAQQTDADIDRDGLAAELAACVMLCPSSFSAWQRAAESSDGNRGRDLLRSWTGLDKHVEVKQTRYHDDQRGYLLVRPPRQTPGRMREEYIDDAYYVLLHGKPFRYEMLGWIDRDRLVSDGQLNPVPVQPGQRECWGIHWSKLSPIGDLLSTVGSGGKLGVASRWLSSFRK